MIVNQKPNFFHFGFRSHDFANQKRWFASEGWNGQFDIIDNEEFNKRLQACEILKICVYDYEDED